MGRIGRKDFVPDLLRVIKKADFLEYIHEDARAAINSLDESAHEALIRAIDKRELTDPDELSAILEHLPYSESYDIAVSRISIFDGPVFKLFEGP